MTGTPAATTAEVLYFGSMGRNGGGHSLSARPHKTERNLLSEIPWPVGFLDGGLLRRRVIRDDGSSLGNFVVLREHGWTCVMFWDRSGDSRPNSVSAFVSKGSPEVPELLELAKKQWPDVFSRPGFPALKAAVG